MRFRDSGLGFRFYSGLYRGPLSGLLRGMPGV